MQYTLLGHISIQTPSGTQRVPVWGAAEVALPALRIRMPDGNIGAIRTTSAITDADLSAIRIRMPEATHAFLDPAGTDVLQAYAEAVKLGETFTVSVAQAGSDKTFTNVVPLAEDFTKSVTPAPEYIKTPTEGIGLGEAFSKSVTAASFPVKEWSESLAIGEDFSLFVTYTQEFAEQIGIGETFSGTVTQRIEYGTDGEWDSIIGMFRSSSADFSPVDPATDVLVILSGDQQGTYNITSVNSETTLELATTLEAETGMTYEVQREVQL